MLFGVEWMLEFLMSLQAMRFKAVFVCNETLTLFLNAGETRDVFESENKTEFERHQASSHFQSKPQVGQGIYCQLARTVGD